MQSGRLHLRHSEFCHIAEGKRIQKLTTTPLSLTFIISKDESHFRLTDGLSSVSRVEMMTRFLFGLSCWADDQIFIWPVLSRGADNQIFVWPVLWG